MKIEDLNFESKMICHMAFDTAHMTKTEITIIAPDKFLNGRKFYKETKTKKRRGQFGSFGKSESVFYFNSESEMFNTAQELIDYILKQSILTSVDLNEIDQAKDERQ